MRATIVLQRQELNEQLSRHRAEIESRLANGLNNLQSSTASTPTVIRVARIPGPGGAGAGLFTPSSEGAYPMPLSIFEKEMLAHRKLQHEQHAILTKAEADIERRFTDQLMALNLEYETSQWQFRSEYDRLIARRIESALRLRVRWLVHRSSR